MRISSGLLLFTLLVIFHSVVADNCLDSLATSDFVDYVTCLSYPVETHIVTTDDGYKLTLFRIQAKNTAISGKKSVVLMWHGLLDSADAWVINEEHIAPGLILANRGYDIWLGNSRGNKYSLGHVSLDYRTSKQFWSFSWMQMSEHDLPAAFSYISNLTKQKINYVGHSQGTTQMFASLSNPDGKNPVVASNLRKFAALGPVAYMSNVRSTLINQMAQIPLLPQIMEQVGKYGLFLPNWFSSQSGRVLCKYLPWACAFGLKLVSDEDPQANNPARYDFLAGHFPAGTSVMDLIHWKQEVNAGGSFQKYDFGATINKQIYGQSKPPKYNPTLIKEDVALFIGNDDLIANTIDAAKWFNDMVNAKKEIHYYPMGHLTFLIGKTLPYMDDLITFLDIHE